MGEYYRIVTNDDNHLEHYGVKGMKWDQKFRKHNDDYYRSKRQRRMRAARWKGERLAYDVKDATKDIGKTFNKAINIANAKAYDSIPARVSRFADRVDDARIDAEIAIEDAAKTAKKAVNFGKKAVLNHWKATAGNRKKIVASAVKISDKAKNFIRNIFKVNI